jgi:hypothetical protein
VYVIDGSGAAYRVERLWSRAAIDSGSLFSTIGTNLTPTGHPMTY